MLHALGVLLRDGNSFALTAVDGRESSADKTEGEPKSGEPAQYFWILFGLSYEVLCTGVASSQELALEALIGLMRTEVSGKALLSSGLFDELCNMCYRLAITEGPGVKERVMEMVQQLAQLVARSGSAL